MINKQIIFTGIHRAELKEYELEEKPEFQNSCLQADRILTQMEYTVVSGGTERACILGMNNTSGNFPMSLGYCGIGRIVQAGKEITDLKPGDRVLVYHGVHAKYNINTRDEITKVEDDQIPSVEAAFVIIASMGLGGVRKLELELGESAMVMGLGLLGIFATQFLRLSGANPLIVADLNPVRRELALQLGADYAFDPSEENFVEKVKQATKGKGIKACVEVTGLSKAMFQALECASYMGRIALLGCTRVSEGTVDYYTKVHKPGIKLIGAHNFVRPKVESYPHHWTHQDDCMAVLDLISRGRLKVAPIVSRIVSPKQATEIYNQLCDDKDFPMGTVFDWTGL